MISLRKKIAANIKNTWSSDFTLAGNRSMYSALSETFETCRLFHEKIQCELPGTIWGIAKP